MPDLTDLCTLLRAPDPERVGAFIYMPREPAEQAYREAYPALSACLSRLPADIAGELRRSSAFRARLTVDLLAHHAGECSDGSLNSTVPAWFRLLPSPYRATAGRSWAIHCLEHPCITLQFPFTGIHGYSADLSEDTLLGQAHRAFRLWRLSNIRQLAWITTPVFPPDRPGVLPMRFEHRRWSHVLDTAAIANLFALHMGLSERETNTLVLAAITHDACTPAGGDTSKLLDRDFFDEDKRYHLLLGAPAVTALLRRYGISAETLNQTVLGNGHLGRLLDIADKTAYVAADSRVFQCRVHKSYTECEEGIRIHAMLKAHAEDACTAWQSVTMREGTVAFQDARALARFLTLRALLFRALYWHPSTRFSEFIVGHVLLRWLIRNGRMRKETLLEWNDQELDHEIESLTGISFLLPDFGEPEQESFPDPAAMNARAAELRKNGESWVMTETFPERMSSGTQFLVTTGTGTAPLRDAYPELAGPVDALARQPNPFRVYWIPINTMPQALREITRSAPDLLPASS